MTDYLYADHKLEMGMEDLMKKARVPNSGYMVLAIDLNYMSIYPFQAGENRTHTIIRTFIRSMESSKPNALFFVVNRRKGIFVALQYEEGGMMSAIPSIENASKDYSYQASYNYVRYTVEAIKKIDGMNGYTRGLVHIPRELKKTAQVEKFHRAFHETMSMFKCREWPRPIYLAEIYALMKGVNHDFRSLESSAH